MKMDYNIANYDNLNEDTKTYINKVIDIYNTIKDIRIEKELNKNFMSKENYWFTKVDKKVLSFFIAGYLVDGALKGLLEQYDDLKLQDFIEFVNVDINNLKKIDENQYKTFYSENLQVEIINFVTNIYGVNVHYITPSVIALGISEHREASDILDKFTIVYKLGAGYLNFFCEHMIVRSFEALSMIEGSISEKEYQEEKKLEQTEYVFEEKEHKAEMNFEDYWDILDEVQNKFVGQEIVTESLFYNIINNQQLSKLPELPDGQRSIIFLDGPTGTGKTAITREITSKLDIPFTASSVVNYSSTGYVGSDITDTLKDLYRQANGDLTKAERGIVVFDELDKLAYSRSGGLEMKRAVQQQLLDFIGGGKYTLQIDRGMMGKVEVKFDTSKLTFIFLGALTDLRKTKTEVRQSIGFSSISQNEPPQEYNITPQDLIGIGLEKELVGRLNTFLHTDDYSKENLMKILKESTISPLIGFKQLIESRGKKLQVTEDAYEIIVEQAYELNTGARSLQTVMNNIRTHFLKEILRGTEEIIYLDSKVITKIGEQSVKRRARI
jgi:ATP-dependent protease Clp ATPase subunit